ncbi:hypothetical protein GCM10011506_13370 [Marivirga lumbricoides]|uniref:Outer membrane porin, OprD family n=1 Tax=Marivirga lumbricoides TaxID=1046115 RepID=A0ABQ1LSF8_9BACT|nr:hypothetical protein GCM10011506_13370 [Marivirga lumbricoides]
MKPIIIFWGLIFLCPILGHTQKNNQQYESIDSVNHGSFNPNEAHSFKEWFQKGHASGLIRVNMMNTLRPESRTYYAALAIGGRLYYHTSYWKGLQLGVGGLYAYNIASTNLSADDYEFVPKWERQLFDLKNTSNKHDLDRLAELFIKYRYNDSYIKMGKMLVETPFVNPQDSRMKPSAFQGIWFDWNEGHQFEINGGIFNKVSPRSTTEWVSISESIGLYDRFLKNDTNTLIHKNINLFQLGGHYNITSALHYHNWQYFVNQLTYVNFNQMEWSKNDLQIGLQYVFQQGLDDEKVFSDQLNNNYNQIISGRLKWNLPNWQISYNTTQSLSDAPFILPKEWGSEPFYTFISRHRIEGLTGINSHTIKIDLQPFHHWTDFNLGIYGARTSFDEKGINTTKKESHFNQLSLDIQARFYKDWDNLSFRLLNTLLFANKDILNPFLKEDILHAQLIVNYKF